jgi:cation diffusion facilitator family transporter
VTTERKVMIIAFAVNVMLMVSKFVGYWITGSSAILSDALESIINVVTAAFALWSVIVAARPPDEDHPYGHGKIEFFSAGFEGALIIFAAAGIFLEGIRQVMDPKALPQLESGLAILVAVTLINLALGWSVLRTGKRLGTLVLQAHGKHILTDVYTTAGVIVGLGLVDVTGWFQLDGAVACLVGTNILVSGFLLVKQAFGGLMDASDPALLDEICRILEEHRKHVWIDIHRLRAWRSGQRVHVDFHLIVPRDLPISEGHGEVKELEAILWEHFDGHVDVLIHLDPCDDPECPVCRHDPCHLRNGTTVEVRRWHRQAVIGDGQADSRA